MGDPGAAEHRALVERHLPDVRVETLVAVEDGWDSLVLDVNDEWIVRVPRRPQVQETLATEITLLPELARTLPVAIPTFEVVVRGEAPVLVAYRKLHGEPLDAAGDLSAAPAIGAANIGAGLFQGFAVSTSGSRTAVADKSGAQTQRD